MDRRWGEIDHRWGWRESRSGKTFRRREFYDLLVHVPEQRLHGEF